MKRKEEKKELIEKEMKKEGNKTKSKDLKEHEMER